MGQAIFAAMLGLLIGMATAADYRATPEDYREWVRVLQPGDRLLLGPGDYLRGLPLHNLAGRADQPIIIEAGNPAAPPRFIARPGANTVSLLNVRHLALRHLILDGRNIPVDAIKAEGHSRFADFITLEHLHIHDYAASQQNVGISTKCPAIGWIVRANRIERVGTGMYFGDSDGSDAFVGGLIESNRISHTLGYNLQIKHQTSRSSEHAGRHDTFIRYNVFSKRDSIPGPQARPNVLLGHFPLAGEGSEDRYLVYGNLFLHNPTEALFQAEGRVVMYDNVLITAGGDAVHVQPHNDVPRDMLIFSNTVLASGTGIQVRQPEGVAYRQRVTSNVVAASQPILGGEASHNVTLGYQHAFANVAVPRLTAHLLAKGGASQGLPASEAHEFITYPDWKTRVFPGAKVAPSLLRILESIQP